MVAARQRIISGATAFNEVRDFNLKSMQQDMSKLEAHYGFWAGTIPIVCNSVHTGRQLIKPYTLTPIGNHSRWERDQSADPTDGKRRHPNPKRAHEYQETDGTAGNQVEHLIRRKGDRGFVDVECLRGGRCEPGDKYYEQARKITTLLLYRVSDERGHLLPYEELAMLVQMRAAPEQSMLEEFADSDDEAERNYVLLYNSLTVAEKDLLLETSNYIMTATDKAARMDLQRLDKWSAEIQQRAVPGGFGIPKMPMIAKDVIRMVGRMEHDYVANARSQAEASAKQAVEIATNSFGAAVTQILSANALNNAGISQNQVKEDISVKVKEEAMKMLPEYLKSPEGIALIRQIMHSPQAQLPPLSSNPPQQGSQGNQGGQGDRKNNR